VLNKKSSVYPCKAYKNRVTDGEGNCQGLGGNEARTEC
jgi:hypothetical protein